MTNASWCRARALCFATALLAVTSGCDRAPMTAAKVEVPVQADAPKTADSAPLPVADAALAIATRPDGVWRVTAVVVANNAPAMFATDDPAIMGSEITIADAALAWSKTASDDFTSDDICKGPRLETVAAPLDPGPASREFDAAIMRFGPGQAPNDQPLHWVCTQGGNWGPEADGGARLRMAGTKRLIMTWYDGVVLVLEPAGK